MRLVDLLMGVMLLSELALAGPFDREAALRELDSVATDLAALPLQGLHRHDQARLFIVTRTLTEVRASVQNVGLGHRQTVNLFQQLFARFQYSSQFFRFIATRRNEASLRRALTAVGSIKQSLGLVENPYSEVIKAQLLQLVTSVTHLQRTSGLNEELRTGLNALRAPLGDALALADQGDRPSPELIAGLAAVVGRLKALYPQLNAASESAAVFSLVMEIVGINEFLGEAVRTPGA